MAGKAPKKGETVPRKREKGGSSEGPALKKKARSAKYSKWCKATNGPFQMLNTSKCHRFDTDSKEVGKPHKPFDSAKKPWKKSGDDSRQMAYLTEKLEKLEKKLKKSKKHAKKRARDSSDSDSNSEQDSGYGSPSNQVYKCLKLDKPSGIDLNSTDTRLIKATRTALNIVNSLTAIDDLSRSVDRTLTVILLAFLMRKRCKWGDSDQ